MGFKHDTSEILAVIRPLLATDADLILDGPKERGSGAGMPLDATRRAILAAEVEALKAALAALVGSAKYADAVGKAKAAGKRWMDLNHFGVGGRRSLEQDALGQWLTTVSLNLGLLLKADDVTTTKGGGP